MSLNNLPNEIIIRIVEDHLSDASDVLSLLLTCRRFVSVLQASLDRLALANRYVERAICFAAAYQRKDKLKFLVRNAQQPPLLPFSKSNWAEYSKQRTFRYIMHHGANLAIKEFYKSGYPCSTTLLHFAVWNLYVGMVEALLVKGANTEALDSDGLTTLQVATSMRDIPLDRPNQIVRLLLEHGANANAQSGHAASIAPIVQAILCGNAYQVRLMSPKDMYKSFEIPHTYELWRVLDLARVLIEKGADPNTPNHVGTPLHYAARGGRPELAKLLIDKGALVDKRGSSARTPLHLAIFSGQEIVNLLLDHGADINLVDNKGRTALHSLVAKVRPNPQLIKLLVERGADPTIQDKYGETPLHIAIRHYIGEDVEAILDLTPDKCLSMRNCKGLTPLGMTIWPSGSRRFVRRLLLRDPDITFVSGDGDPALQLAMRWGDFDLVKRILARHGAKHSAINAKDPMGQTALHYAARKGCKVNTELLLAYGADTSILDCAGQTALHHAARFSAVTTGILLAAGAAVDARDRKGRTPLHYVSKDVKHAAHLLIEWGADAAAKDRVGVPVPDWVLKEYRPHAGGGT